MADKDTKTTNPDRTDSPTGTNSPDSPDTNPDENKDNSPDTSPTKVGNATVDRNSDLATTADGSDEDLNPNRGEELAEEAAEKRSRRGGEVKQIEGEDGTRNFVTTPLEDRSDNKKVYSDFRIDPRDTNAPDAGLSPDGRVIAT